MLTTKENFYKLNYIKNFINIQRKETKQNDIFSRDTSSCGKIKQAQGRLKQSLRQQCLLGGRGE